MTSWIEGLIRDSNNPSILDKNFPQFRIFDWFVGHSWSQVYEIYIYIFILFNKFSFYRVYLNQLMVKIKNRHPKKLIIIMVSLYGV